MSNKSVQVGLVACFGGRRISVDFSKFNLQPERAVVEWSPIEAKVDQALKGQFKTALDFTGATEGALERRVFLAMEDDAGTLYPVSVALTPGSAVGSFAYLSRSYLTSFKHTGDFGQVKGFDMKALPQDRPYFGQVLRNTVGSAGVTAAEPATGAGQPPAVQLGGVAATVTGPSPVAGQKLVVAVHVPDPPGVAGVSPTAQLLLESNPNNTDWSTAVLRATLPLAVTGAPSAGQFQAPGAVWVEIDGDAAAITDTWWRLRVSALTGTGGPEFPLFAVAGVVSKLNV